MDIAIGYPGESTDIPHVMISLFIKITPVNFISYNVYTSTDIALEFNAIICITIAEYFLLLNLRYNSILLLV